MKKIISLFFIVICFQFFGATTSTEKKEFDYQENLSHLIGFFAEANDIGQDEQENQPKVSFVGHSIVALGSTNPTVLKIDFEAVENYFKSHFKFFDFNDSNVILLEHNKRKKENQRFYVVFCNYRL